MCLFFCLCKEEEGEQSLEGACLPGNGGQENAGARWSLAEAPREERGVFLLDEVPGKEEPAEGSRD